MGEADEIKELAERLLTHPIPGSDVPTVTLLPGRVVDDPDLSVPSPPGARVVGSLIREPGWQMPRDIEVVLDAPGSEDRYSGSTRNSLGSAAGGLRRSSATVQAASCLDRRELVGYSGRAMT